MPRRSAALLTVVAALLLAAPAPAAIRHVDIEADENDASCAPGDCSLREAINTSDPNDTIEVPGGHYLLSSELGIGKNLTIDGAGAASTEIDAQGGSRVIHQNGGRLTLREVTITGGYVFNYGAGILSDFMAAGLTLDRVRVTENKVAIAFGGTASTNGGGGLYTTAPTTLTRTTFDGNEVMVEAGDGITNVGGAGIYADGDELTVTDSEVRGNTVDLSGAENTDSPVEHNGGGGIYLRASAELELFRSTVAGNRASIVGGLSSTIDDNGGGGAYANAGAVTAVNSTVAGNSTGTSPGMFIGNGGGGVFTNGTPATLTNVTVAGNTATTEFGSNTGGGIYREGGTVTARNTIIALNQADVDENDNCWGSISSQGRNLEDKNTCALSGAGDQLLKNPLLGPLQPNGGRTRTRALKKGSPAIDAALNCPPVDQRGIARPRGIRCDVGAFEAPMPNAITGGVKNRKPTSAGLRGTVNPNGLATSYRFQYGGAAAYGKQTAIIAAGAGVGSVKAQGKATGLKPAKLYHYRLVATSPFGTTRGADRTFISAMRLPKRKCSDPTSLRVPLKHPAGTKITSVKAFVKGKEVEFVATTENGDIKRIRIDDLPSGKFGLRVVGSLNTGRKVTGKRSYKGCG